MVRLLVRGVALLAVGVGAVGALADARGAAPRSASLCRPRLTVLARGGGSPDDLAWDGSNLLVSDINQGTVGIVTHGRVRVLIRGLKAPEGIVAARAARTHHPGVAGGALVVAEQGINSVFDITLPRGPRRLLARLPLPKGKEGVDTINAAGPGAVFVPDSARGRLYLLRLHARKLSLVAAGMNRPVAAIRWHGAIVVADEYANAVWRIGSARTKLAGVPLPDDLAVISHHLIASSLTGGVWEVAPHLRRLSNAFAPATSDPQGMVAAGASALILADQSRNAIYRLSRLGNCL